MGLKRQEAPKEEIVEVEHEGEKLTFIFEPFLSTDLFFVAQNQGSDQFAKWALTKKFKRLEGETFEDGTEVTPSNVYELPGALVLQVAAEYEKAAVKRIDLVTDEQKKSEKPTTS